MADQLRGGSTVGGNIIWHAGNSNSALADWTANNIIATSVSATTFTGALSGNASTATTASSITGQGALATLSTVNAATITDNSVGAAELNVSGNGTTAQYLRSDGDGTFTWATPTDTDTTYIAGTGLSLVGTTFNNTTPNVTTNLGYTASTTNGTVTSSDGTNATIPLVVAAGNAGLMTGTDKTKLDGIASGATANAGTVTSVSGSGSLTGTVTTSGSISHLATDGHLHVPATSTTNSGKVLTAGATAGSLSWQTPTVGTVTSVVAGNGMTQTGTSTVNPTLNIVSHAGTAGTIGTINVGADAIGVNLGTTSTTAARGDHTHSYLPLTGGTLSGALTATSFSGVGTSLTALNATNLTTGTLPDARLTGSYTGLTNLTGTGTVDFAKFLGNAADTVTAPSFSWTGDDNTGIYSPGADQLAVTTGGVQRALFNSSGITGNLVGNVTGNVTGSSGTCAGNAGSATVLQTVRTINGVSFNGSANITIVDSTKAPLVSPVFTGTPTAPTAPAGTNTTQVATTAFVLANSVQATEYATSTVGGTVKARLDGTTLYLTINGADA